MAINAKLAYYLRVCARYVEDPRQLALRRPYFLPDMYHTLGQPWVQALEISTVLDIGANVGGFAFTVRPLFPQAQIYSFEPLPDCFAQMRANLANASKFQAFNLGLGDQTGDLSIQRSSHAPSSSFLRMTSAHQVAFPASAVSQEEKVSLARLDDLAPQLHLAEPILVKIDVQGYEDHVLRGGAQTIQRARLIIVETSFEAFYENQPLFGDIYQRLTGWGFSYAGPLNQLNQPKDGRPLQEDSLFVKASHA